MLQRNQKRKFQKIASAVFGIGIALLAGCSTAKPVVNASSPQKTYGIDWSEETGQKLPKSLSGRRVEGPTYGVHIIGNVYGSVWRGNNAGKSQPRVYGKNNPEDGYRFHSLNQRDSITPENKKKDLRLTKQ